jgi:sigma-B regulation protein RsbU (phosphoserine phosphatase)
MSRLLKKTLLLMIVLFGVIATGTSIVSGWNLYKQLTLEYRSKGAAIAKSIADASVEIIVNRDPSTVQAIVDQFDEIDGVAYVFVADRAGNIFAHTFVPSVPPEFFAINRRAATAATDHGVVSIDLYVPRLGDVTDISAPILTGVGGYTHVGMDRSVIRAKIWSAVFQQQVLMLLIFLASVVIAYLLVNRISQPLNLLAHHARSLAASDISDAPNIPASIEALSRTSKDEIGNLAGSFVHMERALQRSIENLKQTTAAKERIESELKIAHNIQMSMVPKIFPPFPDREEFDLYATLVPAREVGGDFYDFFFLDNDRLCLAIGDVSGKGVPASLFMAVTKTLFKATAAGNDHPDEILERLNDELCRDNTACMFVTLFGAILDIRTGQVEYSNGGHNLPYKLSNGQPKQFENTKGTVVGALEDAKFESNTIALETGDWIIFYTDGVTEAMDEHKELFADHRLEQFLVSLDRNVSAEELTHSLASEVRRFSATTEQSDDITIMALRYWGIGNHGHSKVTLELKNDLSELAKLNHTLTEFGQRHQLPDRVLFAIKLALEETVTNAISHNFTDEREHRISIRLSLEQSVLRADVEDDGRAFNPLDIPAPDPKKPLEERPLGGLGIHLARTLMDEVAYRRQNGRNMLTLKKEIAEL